MLLNFYTFVSNVLCLDFLGAVHRFISQFQKLCHIEVKKIPKIDKLNLIG